MGVFRDRALSCALISLFLMAFVATTNAQPPIKDTAALGDLKVGKGVFLIDFTNPKKTAFYLDVIRGTHAGMKAQGVEPDFVLVFIGQTVAYLSTQPSDELMLEFGKELREIAGHVAALHALGVRMEVCAVATRVFGVDNEKILPEMHVVGDGFISLIGWQSQGYKLVPIF